MLDFLRDFKTEKTKAVILGKGPSFEKYKGDFDSSWLICGINQAMSAPGVSLGIAAHIEPLEEKKEVFSSLEAVVVPYFPLYGWDTHHDKSHKDYEFLKRDNVYCYNPMWCGNRVSNSQVIQSFGTTTHHLVEMLALLGLKEFHFFGIDGGRKAYGKKYYADGFKHDDKYYFEQGKIPADFDKFWEPYFIYRRKFGLKYTFA